MHHGDAVSPISAHSPKANGFTRFSTAALLLRAWTSLQCLIQPHRLHVQGGIIYQELQTCRTHLQNFWGLGMALGLSADADQMGCSPAHPSAFGWEATIHRLQQPDIGDILQRHFRYQRALIGGAMVIGQHRHVEVHLKARGELQARDHVLPTPISTIQCIYIYLFKYRQDNIITLCEYVNIIIYLNSVSYVYMRIRTHICRHCVCLGLPTFTALLRLLRSGGTSHCAWTKMWPKSHCGTCGAVESILASHNAYWHIDEMYNV